MKNVMITKQKTAFEKNLAKIFEREGYNIFTAKEVRASDTSCDKIDIYIDVSNERDISDTFSIRDGLDEDIIKKIYKTNVIKPMRTLEKYMPLLDAGKGKRLCFLSSKEASINETKGTTGYAYKLSKAAMHNFFQMASNKLTPNGYTFRVYDPMTGEIDAKLAAEAAFNYFTRRRGTENDDGQRDDETRLVFRDALGREHTW